MKTRIISLLILTCILLSTLCSCADNSQTATNDTAQTVTTGEIGVIQDTEYGGIMIDLPKEYDPDKYEAILENVNDFLYCIC